MSQLRIRLLTLIAFLGSISNAYLIPRDSNTTTCTGIQAQSNDGDRKIAIVIDSSSSMLMSDPYDLRISAGKSILDWLISKNEASGSKKADSVAVIDFADTATLDYGLGDPDGAYSALDNITAFGGTYIASGVEMAIAQLTAGGTGATADRSGIVVFTDGEDGYVTRLVDAIDKSSKAGIRVTFGYLSPSTTYTNAKIQTAIKKSGGRYFTVGSAQASVSFVNGLFLNGITKKDNPAGNDEILLAGLDISNFISGSETQTMTYAARAKEKLSVTVQSINAGSIKVEVKSGSTVLASDNAVSYPKTMNVTAPGDGNIDVKVTAKNAPKDSLFLVGVQSDFPLQNCTVGVSGNGGGGGGGTNKAVIIGPTVGVALALILGGLGYLLWKYLHSKTPPTTGNHGTPEVQHAPGSKGISQVNTTALPSPPPTTNWFKEYFKFPTHPPPVLPPPPYPTTQNNVPPPAENNNPMEYESGSEWEEAPEQTEGPNEDEGPGPAPLDPAHKKKKHGRVHRIRIYGNNHHHHIPPGHPCYYDECPLALPDHVCNDPYHPCTCVDPKCKLNSRRHICKEQNSMPHKCFGPKDVPNCPLNDPPYMEAKEKEHSELVRKYMAQDAAVSGVKMAATFGIRGLAMV